MNQKENESNDQESGMDHAVVMVRLHSDEFERMVKFTPATDRQREVWRKSIIKSDNVQKASDCVRDICDKLKEVATELEEGGKDNYRAERMILAQVSECVRAIDFINSWDDFEFTMSSP